MQIFDDITFGWKGSEYSIQSNKVLGAIARIEEIMTFQELVLYQARGTLPLAKLAQAYGSALRYAGARCSDEEVYASMFSNDDGKNASMVTAISTLLMMMVPKDLKVQKGAGEATKGKRRKGDKRSSKNSSSSQSAVASGSLPNSSGG